MANDDHTARLMKGWAAWNAWREDNPDVRQPHLVKAFLAGADFRGANLGGADLRETRAPKRLSATKDA